MKNCAYFSFPLRLSFLGICKHKTASPRTERRRKVGIRKEVVTRSAGRNFCAGNNTGRFPHLSLLLHHGLGELRQYLWMKMGDEIGGKTVALLMFFLDRDFALGKSFLMTKSTKSSDSRHCSFRGSVLLCLTQKPPLQSME